MSQEINFDAIVPRPIKITKGGTTYELRDDVPMALMLRTFEIQALGEQVQAQLQAFNPATTTASEASKLLSRVFGEVTQATLALFGDLWRHTETYREMTNEALADLFSYEEQGQIINAFFMARLGTSIGPSAATSGAGPTPASPSANESTATRGAARQQREAKRRR